MAMSELGMGDSPINLDISAARRHLLYSIQFTDKTVLKEAFNIVPEQRGHTKKQKRKTKMSPTLFKDTVKQLAPVVLKTRGERCTHCNGTGKIRSRLKSGALSKVQTKCKVCGGTGVVYTHLR